MDELGLQETAIRASIEDPAQKPIAEEGVDPPMNVVTPFAVAPRMVGDELKVKDSSLSVYDASKAKNASARPVRVVLYARCSMAKKGHLAGTSIERQFELGEAYATTNFESFRIVARYADDGISGKYTAKLKSLAKLMLPANLQSFDVLITEDEDRIGRTTFEVCKHFSVLASNNVDLHTVKTGRSNKLLSTIRVAVAEAELEKIQTRVRSSRRMYLKNGRQLGIVCYGYRLVNDVPTEDPIEGPIVREAFELFGVQGVSATQICHIFEKKGYIAPGGGYHWNVLALIGKRMAYEDGVMRVGGILCRTTYMGERVTSLVKQVKDELGNSTCVVQDKDQWQFQDVEPLVTKEIYEAAKMHFRRIEEDFNTPDRIRSGTNYLFSRLLRCPFCSGHMILCGGSTTHSEGVWGGGTRYGCKNFTVGECENSRTYLASALSRAIVQVTKEWFSSIDVDKAYRQEIEKEMYARHKTIKPDYRKIETEIAELDRESIATLREKITAKGDVEIYDMILDQNNARKRVLQADLLSARATTREEDIQIRKFEFGSLMDVLDDIPFNLKDIDDDLLLKLAYQYRSIFRKIDIYPAYKPGNFCYRIDSLLGLRAGTVNMGRVWAKDIEVSVLKQLEMENAPLSIEILYQRLSGQQGDLSAALKRLQLIEMVRCDGTNVALLRPVHTDKIKMLPHITFSSHEAEKSTQDWFEVRKREQQGAYASTQIADEQHSIRPGGYPEAVKREAARQVANGSSQQSVADRFGASKAAVMKWAKRYPS